MVLAHWVKLEEFTVGIIGRIRAISTSKIKKIIAIRKNRSEKGNRDDLLGSNPHSKGEHFSRSINDFLDINDANIITTTEIIKIVNIIAKIEKIIYTKFI